MKDAISKNSIVAIRLVDKQLLGDAKVLHYKGEKTTLYDKTVGRYRLMKEYDDTLIKYYCIGSDYNNIEVINGGSSS